MEKSEPNKKKVLIEKLEKIENDIEFLSALMKELNNKIEQSFSKKKGGWIWN